MGRSRISDLEEMLEQTDAFVCFLLRSLEAAKDYLAFHFCIDKNVCFEEGF